MSGAVVLICAALAVTPVLALLACRRLATERQRWDAHQRLAEQLWWMRVEMAAVAETIGARLIPAFRNLADHLNRNAAEITALAFPSPSNQQGSNRDA